MWKAIKRLFGKPPVPYEPSELAGHIQDALRERQDDWEWEDLFRTKQRVRAANTKAGLTITFWEKSTVAIEFAGRTIRLKGEERAYVSTVLHYWYDHYSVKKRFEEQVTKQELLAQDRSDIVAGIKEYLN